MNGAPAKSYPEEECAGDKKCRLFLLLLRFILEKNKNPSSPVNGGKYHFGIWRTEEENKHYRENSVDFINVKRRRRVSIAERKISQDRLSLFPANSQPDFPQTRICRDRRRPARPRLLSVYFREQEGKRKSKGRRGRRSK